MTNKFETKKSKTTRKRRYDTTGDRQPTVRTELTSTSQSDLYLKIKSKQTAEHSTEINYENMDFAKQGQVLADPCDKIHTNVRYVIPMRPSNTSPDSLTSTSETKTSLWISKAEVLSHKQRPVWYMPLTKRRERDSNLPMTCLRQDNKLTYRILPPKGREMCLDFGKHKKQGPVPSLAEELPHTSPDLLTTCPRYYHGEKGLEMLHLSRT